jgi:hypothetical protein
MKTKRKKRTFEVGVYVSESPDAPQVRLIPVGAKFTFRSSEILGAQAVSHFKPPFEGEGVMVVGFKPRYVKKSCFRMRVENSFYCPPTWLRRAWSWKNCAKSGCS